MTDLLPHVVVVDGTMFVSSLDVATRFEKPHADVLKAIRKIIAECPEEFGEGNFSLSSYANEQGKELPMYRLSRDAFSLLAMGFTGKQALTWKLKFIEAFNAMEKSLIERASGPALSAEDRALLDELRRERGKKAASKALPAPSPAFDPSHYIKAMRLHSRQALEEYSKMISALNDAHPMNWNRHYIPGTTDNAVLPMRDMVEDLGVIMDRTLRAVEHNAEAYARVKRL